jgi:hypothetical protein
MIARRLLAAAAVAAVLLTGVTAATAQAAEPSRGGPEPPVSGLVTDKAYRPHDYVGPLALPIGPECWLLLVVAAEAGPIPHLVSTRVCVTERVWRATPRWSHVEGLVPLRYTGRSW